jgi:hypothetical protein
MNVLARLVAPLTAAAALLAPGAAQAQGADPAGSGPIVAALGWMQGTLLGTVATAVAVMAVAAVGFTCSGRPRSSAGSSPPRRSAEREAVRWNSFAIRCIAR